ncbi:MAG: NhaC family Na+:H+ antiporter [Maribacter sp.]|jgi:NhaC family Na+:H+ antiporter
MSDIKDADDKIIINDELNIWEALIPVIILIALLAYNIFAAGGELLGQYSNHYILLFGGLIAALVGFYNKVDFWAMFLEVWENLKSVFTPILILLLVGALTGTWMISGVVPSMVYYGLQILNPTIFLPAAVVICAIISLATGSSWTTSATVGIALIGIAGAMGVPLGMTAGAVISGAYFGDKLSPLSDTTNLAPAMAGTDLFTHIKYMLFTTVPSITVALVVFIILGLTLDVSETGAGNTVINDLLTNKFNITPWLFLVPMAVIIMILLKMKPLVALSVGTLLGGVFAIIFQPEIIKELSGSATLDFKSYFGAIYNAIVHSTELSLPGVVESMEMDGKLKENLVKLLQGKGMEGMLWTVYLIISAMFFGGLMEAIGALSRISGALLSLSDSVFGLFASTVGSCLALNVTASDQYLAIVIPGKMFAKAYEDKGLAPENLSRTLEDSGTVTSVLIPWNTCGAYQSGVLGVGVGEYAIYAIFNWVSPMMTLIFAGIGIKIRMLVEKE